MRVAIASCLAGAVLFVLACNEKDEAGAVTPSKVVVAQAARATFEEEALALGLDVRGRDARGGRDQYRVWGIEQPGRGRYLVDASTPDAAPGEWAYDKRVRVAGQDGEGFETTSYVEGAGLPAHDRRCWFNPHWPVGFPGEPLSVEESVRLTGAVLESLRSEVAGTQLVEDGFAVRLRPSASHPRNDFRSTKKRVWGDRNLIAFIDSPIEVSVRDGSISSLALVLRRSGPKTGSRGLAAPPKEAHITASFGATNERLRLNPPRCTAME